ncbi:MarR family winged helix-turn-helix transcriptional regulator [Arthrobacter sp. AET 35A]|uniref:MarR family winged helix-turn-helix transcriptional regulator n=1 Tax=Arthrobacter sp. AET 35A TaxID=2292643 RepID=UPI00177E988E|nr:MarR family transcriptional regulator [Arthrobacter sp. AET 35A]MBE0011067.1 MarR family transcriptional regulator [Arthrobacter sp. AET 35A]
MPDLEQWSTGRLLNTAARLSENALNQALVRSGVTQAGLTILRVLEEHGQMSQNTLAAMMHVQPQTIGKALERLESSQHVCRTPGAQDHRVRIVSTSQKGRGALDQANIVERSLELPDAAQIQALRAGLRTIIDQFQRL